MEAMSVLTVHCMTDFQDFQILAVTLLAEVLFVCFLPPNHLHFFQHF